MRTERKFIWKGKGGSPRKGTLPVERKTITLQDGTTHEVDVTVCPRQYGAGGDPRELRAQKNVFPRKATR